MKKVLVLAVLVLLAAAMQANAAYLYNWTSNFDQPKYVTGALDPTPVQNAPAANVRFDNTTIANYGQDRWFLPNNGSYTTDAPMDVTAGAGIGGTNGLVQRTGVSMAARDMRGGYPQWSFYKGFAKFWVFDPGLNTAVGRVDGRVGIYGNMGPFNIGYMATAQIQDATSRDPNYWYAQWSYSVAKMDGNAVTGGTGYSFTAGPAAPRVYNAWSYVMISWAFTYTNSPKDTTKGTATIKFFINQSTVTPNLTLNYDDTAGGRWTNFREVCGIYVGDGMTTSPSGRNVTYDNIEFHGNAIPEPSSLLALGTGAVGLLGLIRRRK